MAFHITANVEVERDSGGRITLLRHIHQPYVGAGSARTPGQLASEYLRDVAETYGIPLRFVQAVSETASPASTSPDMLVLTDQKSVLGTTTVSFAQTHDGLPVWEAGVSVYVLEAPLRVIASQSSVHPVVELQAPLPKAAQARDAQVVGSLRKQLPAGDSAPKINGSRPLIYRYDPELRFDPESRGEPQSLEGRPPVLKLAPVPRTIHPGAHYFVRELLFAFAVPGWGEINWRAFIEPRSGSVLYLRAFVACATGYVYVTDPETSAGGPAPTGSLAQLNALRSLVSLDGITPAGPGTPQSLSGDFVALSDFSPPAITPPTEISGNFLYDVTTDNFSAVNTFYHLEVLYHLVQSMGFNIATYFDGTAAQPGFPLPADHRATVFGCSDCVNAACNGNVAGNGAGNYIFALEEAGTTVGIADDPRVVAHEFCHALLWDSVNSPNFGFAHSAGDSLAVILNDPATQAADRYESFPWVTAGTPGISRRHDRAVGSGWAWGGVNDFGGYSSEQILSTTLFRLYRAAGGDATPYPDAQRTAARYIFYLIVRAIGSLATTPITPTPTPNIFATALMTADGGTALFDGIAGGAINKVIRWAFEKQGLYQLPGAPTPIVTAGAPTPVDVYIDDGRSGEYDYESDFWENQNIWNRLGPDGGLTHQTPILGVPNYVYVRVGNRGQQAAPGVIVRGFHCKPSSGLVWPDDWTAMDTPELSVSSPIPAGASTIVGPFQWTPQVAGHECLLMYVSATGDISNADSSSLLPCASGPTPHWRLVPNDNNIGQRNVAPVPGGGGGLRLSEALKGRRFSVDNPYERPVKVEIEASLPAWLAQLGWSIRFTSPGGSAFRLPPRAFREIAFDLLPGRDFTARDIRLADGRSLITMRARIEGTVVGGMSYQIDPALKEVPREHSARERGHRSLEAAEDLLESLDIDIDDVKEVRIKSLSIEIET